MNIKTRINTAKEHNIFEHLKLCDKQFITPLSLRVNIGEYSKKLAGNARLFEAWDEANLVGLVAMYIDNDEEGFITNVSVCEEYMGKGIATMIFNLLIINSIESGVKTLRLEVYSINHVAIKLYEKFGFKKYIEKDDSLVMLKKINQL